MLRLFQELMDPGMQVARVSSAQNRVWPAGGVGYSLPTQHGEPVLQLRTAVRAARSTLSVSTFCRHRRRPKIGVLPTFFLHAIRRRFVKHMHVYTPSFGLSTRTFPHNVATPTGRFVLSSRLGEKHM